MVYAALFLEGPVLTVVCDRMEYGAVQGISPGLVEDEVFVVVHMVYAAAMFAGVTVTSQDGRTEYGEARFVAIGRVDDAFLVLVFTERGDKIRLISARKGGRRDRRKYEAGLVGRHLADEGSG